MKRKIKNILITRQPDQSVTFVNLLSSDGYYPFILPMIETMELPFDCDDVVCDYLIFTSVNAVKFFSGCLKKIRWKEVIAVGEKTKDYLKRIGIKVGFVPKKFSSDGLVELLSGFDLKEKKLLIPTTKKRTDALENFLKQAGADAVFLYVYDTNNVIYPKGYVDNFIKNNNIDVLTFASPSAAKSFMSQSNLDLSEFIVISIGKTTADYLEKKGIKSYFPEKFTVEGMVELIKKIDRGLV